jgi:hypothetical protein
MVVILYAATVKSPMHGAYNLRLGKIHQKGPKWQIN